MFLSFLRLALPLATILVAAACATPPYERVAGTLLDPLCMPDGSALIVQYSNTKGSFVGTKGRRDNCAWYEAITIETARAE